MKEWAKAFYKSKAWLKCRRSYIARVHGLCERCPTPTPGKIVHHRIVLTPQNINDPSVTLNHEHLELLCATCHQHEHFKTNVTRDDVAFDADGNLIRL